MPAAPAPRLSKQAFDVLPGVPHAVNLDSATLMDRVMRYGPASLAVGAGAAGAVNLLGEYRRQQKLNAKDTAAVNGTADNDTLVVRVPAKTASAAVSRRERLAKIAAFHLPEINARTLSTAGIVGALGTAATGTAYAGLHTPTPVEQQQAAAEPSTLYENPMRIGIPVAGALAGYGLIDHLMNSRKKQDLQTQLDHSKAQYGQMLGQTLGEPNAKSAAAHFPALEGFVAGAFAQLNPTESFDKEASSSLLANMASSPVTLALLSGAVAHKLVHDREVQADEANQVKKFSPPKAIRIQTVPQPVHQLGLPSAAMVGGSDPALAENGGDPNNQDAKLAGFGELAEMGGVAMLAGGKGKKEEGGAAEPGAEGEPVPAAPANPEPVIHELSPNAAQIDTPAGSTGIEAADPGAVALLRHRKQRLARILAVSAANAGQKEAAEMAGTQVPAQTQVAEHPEEIVRKNKLKSIEHLLGQSLRGAGTGALYGAAGGGVLGGVTGLAAGSVPGAEVTINGRPTDMSPLARAGLGAGMGTLGGVAGGAINGALLGAVINPMLRS